jgi:ubiquitin
MAVESSIRILRALKHAALTQLDPPLNLMGLIPFDGQVRCVDYAA